MKTLLPSDRPREKLLQHGAGALGDNELVALVLGTGGRRGGALEIATELLSRVGGLHGIARSTSDELARVGGIGRARAAQLLAALEMGRRTLAHAPQARMQIHAPRQAAQLLLAAFAAAPHEQFGVMLLDARHRLIRTSVLAVGTSNAVVVEPRDVFREAVAGRATAIVVFHNHPSGDPTPSPADVDLTRRLVAAGVLMGVDVMDHIVLGEARYCSLKEMGQI